jgi:hypothetical protein
MTIRQLDDWSGIGRAVANYIGQAGAFPPRVSQIRTKVVEQPCERPLKEIGELGKVKNAQQNATNSCLRKIVACA